jgi:hypothetical protein
MFCVSYSKFLFFFFFSFLFPFYLFLSFCRTPPVVCYFIVTYLFTQPPTHTHTHQFIHLSSTNRSALYTSSHLSFSFLPNIFPGMFLCTSCLLAFFLLFSRFLYFSFLNSKSCPPRCVSNHFHGRVAVSDSG